MRPDIIARGLGLIAEGFSAKPSRVANLPHVASMAEPQLVERIMTITALGITALLVWASLAKLDDIARAGGILVAHGNNAVVQHSEGGLLEDIYVQEGQTVTIGQPLLKLNDTDVEADTATIRQRMEFLAAQVQRLGYVLGIQHPIFAISPQATTSNEVSFLSPTLPLAAVAALLPPPDDSPAASINLATLPADILNMVANIEPAAGPMPQVLNPAEDPQTQALKQRYRTLQSGLSLAQSEYQRQQGLRNQGYSTQSRVYAAERDMQAQSQSLAAFQADLASQYASAMSEYNQQDEQLKKLNQRAQHTILRAPTTGIVQGLRLNTSGATVPAGTTLMEIVPEGARLEALLRLSPSHIGMVKVGQTARIRVTTFESSHFGTLEGTVSRISADALTDSEGRPSYQIWVRIPQTLQSARGNQLLKPGMVLVAAVVTGRHSIMDYILRPIRNALDDLGTHGTT